MSFVYHPYPDKTRLPRGNKSSTYYLPSSSGNRSSYLPSTSGNRSSYLPSPPTPSNTPRRSPWGTPPATPPATPTNDDHEDDNEDDDQDLAGQHLCHEDLGVAKLLADDDGDSHHDQIPVNWNLLEGGIESLEQVKVVKFLFARETLCIN